jgi:hypothetical protein
MPARRRAQEAARAERRRRREQSARDRTANRRAHHELDEERVWEEHQAYERYRRSPLPLDELQRREERRQRTAQQILRALRVVESDFARWRAK